MKIKTLIIVLLICFLTIIGLFWLAFAIILFSTMSFILFKFVFQIKLLIVKKPITSIIIFTWIVIVAISLKLFTIDIFKIPSSSMQNTLFPNDVILVNKLKYGPRLPRSPFDIPLVNIGYYFNENAKKRFKEYWWPYKRLSGVTTIKQGDVIVFNSVWKKDYILVKRCAAIAGDTFHIENGIVYINGKIFKVDAAKYRYKFKVKDNKAFYNIIDSLSLGYINFSRIGQKGYLKAMLSKEEVENIKSLKSIEAFQLSLDTYRPKQKLLAELPNKKWTYDEMGPFIIPNKGLKINLNSENYLLYKKIINKFEKANLNHVNGKFYIKGKITKTYTFKKNYYFMMGDNRKATLDSRAWGFLPEENIIGKVQCVLFSNYQDKFQWNRLFKSIN